MLGLNIHIQCVTLHVLGLDINTHCHCSDLIYIPYVNLRVFGFHINSPHVNLTVPNVILYLLSVFIYCQLQTVCVLSMWILSNKHLTATGPQSIFTDVTTTIMDLCGWFWNIWIRYLYAMSQSILCRQQNCEYDLTSETINLSRPKKQPKLGNDCFVACFVNFGYPYPLSPSECSYWMYKP